MPQPTRRRAGAWALGLACLGMAGLGGPAAGAKPAAEVPIGQALPEVMMRGLNGPNRPLSSFRGKALIINVWASWCGPCRQEMASLERLAWRESAVPFAILGISTDDYPEKAKALLRATNATISHFIDHELELEHLLGATHLPLTVLVDAQGRVLRKVVGAQEWDSPASIEMITNTFRSSRRPAPTRR